MFLGIDPQLQRQVAIKTLRPDAGRSPQRTERLIAEARIISTLHHPNIVALYEYGEHEDQPFLVFEYLDGETLADFIRRCGALDISKAVIWMSQLLGALAHAHDHGVLHLDLKPANILIGKDGLPKVADFGVARMLWEPQSKTSELPGTVRYMCPERFSNQSPTPSWDVFALGLIFHEMLTGQPAIDGETDFRAIYRIVHEVLPLPSMVDPRIDSRIDPIVSRALLKDPAKRYADAREMKAALDRFRVPERRETLTASDQVEVDATVEFLLRRMKHKGDFPILSRNLSQINQIASRNNASAKELANAILKDMALTKKLLTIANSAFYGQAGANVTSIYQAVLVMGIDQVRLAVGSLICAAHFQGGANAGSLKEVAIQSFVGAMLAKNIACVTGLAGDEEAFICAMFRHLGKSLVIHYLADEFQAIEAGLTARSADESIISRQVLGIPYHALGQAVARTWKLPEKLATTMAPYPAGRAEPPRNRDEALWQCTSLADEICQAVAVTPPEQRWTALAALAERYQDGLELPVETLVAMIAPAADMSLKYARLVGVGVDGTGFMRRLNGWSAEAESDERSAAEPDHASSETKPSAPEQTGAPAHNASTATEPKSRVRGWLSAIWR